MSKDRSRIEGLDALRGLAALGVLLFHYSTAYDDYGPRHVAPGLPFGFVYGQFGVELFFIISGFVIYMTLENTRHIYDFVASRVARLYPAFLACAFATLVTGFSFDFQSGKANLVQIAANLTMAPQFFGQFFIDGSYWTLAYELSFYGLAGVAVLVFGLRKPELPCLGWLVIAAVLDLLGPDATPEPLRILCAAGFAQFFILGIMLYRIQEGKASRLTYGLLSVSLALALAGPDRTVPEISGFSFFVLIAGFCLLVRMATASKIPVLSSRPLLLLGRISYPLYLVHQNVGFPVIRRLEQAGVSPMLAVSAAVAVVLSLALVISNRIEWPMQRRLRAFFAELKHRVVAQPVPDFVPIAGNHGGRTR